MILYKLWFIVLDIWYKVYDKYQTKSQFYYADLIYAGNHNFLYENQNANIYQEE